MGRISAEKQQQMKQRKYPLLGETIPNVGTNKRKPGNCCIRVIFGFLPLLFAAVIMGFLYLLIYKGGAQPMETSVSLAMSAFEPQNELIGIAIFGGTLGIITTWSRDVQIAVHFGRDGTYNCCLKATNAIAALSNTFGYIGFVLLTVYKIDSEDETEGLIHTIGSFMFFGLASLYAILQSAILFKQKQYPKCIKIVLLLVAITETALIVGYVILEEQAYVLEWVAVALIAFYIGLFFILFCVDPVDDELVDFFCCCCRCCCRRRKKGVSVGKNTRPVNTGRAAVELA